MTKPASISRRAILKGAAAAGGAVLGAPMINLGRYRLFAQSQGEYSARTIELIGRSLVIDTLGVFTVNGEKGWVRDPGSITAQELEEFRESGINVMHNASGVPTYESALRFIAGWGGFILQHDDYFFRVSDVRDLDREKDSGRIGIIMGIQNAGHFRTVDDVNLFHGLGQRISQLTYNTRNRVGNGCFERRDGGLSDYGVAVVERMNEVGMAVDVAHCGDQTTLDAFEVSSKPVLITHSNARALAPKQMRCKTDEAIRAMARAGSIIGLTGVRMFVRDTEPTTIEHVLDHFDHVAKLVGVEHIAVGSDMDLHGYDAGSEEEHKRLLENLHPKYGVREKLDIDGIDHPKRMYDLTEGLIRRGYSDSDIEGILGGHMKRVLGEIWKS